MVEYALSQGVGYGVVVGVGLAFSLGMIATTWILRRYQREIITAEEFATAGRSVKTGLIASAVVSSWTWAATLLQSTSQVYKNGIGGAFYYAAGATCQIVLFAFLAVTTKSKAPGAHTYLELIKARYGTAAHFVYIFFGISTNILVTAMLLTGGSAVITDITGMNSVAACFLLPVGVVIYTLFGGLKATFLTDYAHTIALVIIILTFAFTAFASSDTLGSPGKVWELVTARALVTPIEGNAEGSYLTMKTRSGGIFFVINIVGNFGTVFLDNGYWNKAIASSPAAALPGYVLGGLAWMAIPWLTATTMGLAAVALEDHPSFPTYPNRLTSDQVSSGLVLPNAAVALMGKGGAGASLVIVFFAVTSAMSAELIAVSSIFTYDIYKGYINPNAKGKTLILTSHASVIAFGLAMSGFATGLHYAGVSMGYLYELMGVIISSAVLPCALTVLSVKQNKQAAIWSPILGCVCAIASWLGSTKSLTGAVTYENTFVDDPMLIGNVVALLSPLIFVPVLTYAFGPQNFDWEVFKTIRRVDETEEILEAEGVQSIDEETGALKPVLSVAQSYAHDIAEQRRLIQEEEEAASLKIAAKRAGYICIFLTLAMIVVWPMPMYGSGYVFSKKFFTGWIVVAIIWMFYTLFMVVIYPVYEGRHGIFTSLRGIYWDCTGQTHKLRAWQNDHPEELHVVQSQISAELHQGQAINQLLEVEEKN
ncbi:unnamed protein product [Kuraishia capsulata CBS 1993]|uniref:Urea active transporter n=1 Tax=Kuraishia capsulata CBS 1993 TaxID=1382522 RepID=W6MF16_9ASCO|nr:uncharacterized protein KUCA_T00000064001 [Kuraishia capsulata CBS 1993]CDK24104.1 unnamed protein product [Kuraishia capsulata CBS 1993]